MTSKINYSIKLLSDNNIVLAEAKGYESEIFMPHIVNGRITFLNVIPNRRCCQGKTTNKKAGQPSRPVVKCEMTTPLMSELPKMERFSAGVDKENFSQPLRPLAMSTPASKGKNSLGGARRKEMISSIVTPSMGGDSTLPTPEPVRRAAPIRNDYVFDSSMNNVPRGVKVMRLYHNSTDGTPRKVGRLVSTSNGCSITQQELHNLSSSFRINESPQLAKEMVASTPLNKRLANVVNQESACKWRKCLTPKKTYSRRGNHAVPKHDKSLSSIRKRKPSYLANPTIGPMPTHTVEVRKRRLKVDEQVRIPSKVIKRQQKKNNKLATSASNIEYLEKTRKHLGKSPMSAFDLLINSNRKRCISNKLNQQFQRGCINKASSTYNKYRILSTVPALKEDEQVLEITSSQGQSFQQFVEQIDKGSGNDKVESRAMSTMLPVPCNSSAGSLKPTVAFARPRTPQKLVLSKRHGKTESQTAHYVLQF